MSDYYDARERAAGVPAGAAGDTEEHIARLRERAGVLEADLARAREQLAESVGADLPGADLPSLSVLVDTAGDRIADLTDDLTAARARFAELEAERIAGTAILIGALDGQPERYECGLANFATRAARAIARLTGEVVTLTRRAEEAECDRDAAKQVTRLARDVLTDTCGTIAKLVGADVKRANGDELVAKTRALVARAEEAERAAGENALPLFFVPNAIDNFAERVTCIGCGLPQCDLHAKVDYPGRIGWYGCHSRCLPVLRERALRDTAPAAPAPDAAPVPRMTPAELLRRGGPWLGAARQWLQWHKHNGDRVTWGSLDVLQPPFTARDVDELAAEVAAALWPPGAPPAVLDAARVLTRWHHGASANHAGDMFVRVRHDEWDALRRAVDGHPKQPDLDAPPPATCYAPACEAPATDGLFCGRHAPGREET